MKFSLLRWEPATPFAECPNCKRLLRAEVRTCPECREEISEEYAMASMWVNYYNTQAVGSANFLKSTEPGVVILLISSAIGFSLGSPSLFVVNLVTPLSIIVGIAVWFYRFGRFPLGDDEYLSARRKILSTLKLWCALWVFQVLVCIYLFRVRG